jgi:hypothetical protein
MAGAFFLGEVMGLSKKDLSRKKANLKAKLEELEKKARMDPLKKNKSLHEEIAVLKRKIEKR